MIEREIELVRADGQKTTVLLGIDSPTRQPGGEWACAVSMRGLYELKLVRGIDGFQAVVLARSLLRQLLAAELERGATLSCWGESATIDEIFGA